MGLVTPRRRDKLRAGLSLARASLTGHRAPLFVGWSITDRCNQSCGYCGRWDRGLPDLPDERLMRLPDEMATAGVFRTSLTGGEALLHPRCVDLARALHRLGIQVSLSTNGILLPRFLDELTPLLSGVVISLDGEPASHDAIRGRGAWDEAVTGAREAGKAGLDVGLHAVLVHREEARQHERNIEAVLEVARELNAKAGFAPVEDVPGMGRDLAALLPQRRAWQAAVDHLISLKRAGERCIQNSLAGLRYLHNWPDYQPIACSAARVYARIEPDGTLFGCGNLVRGEGISIQDRSFREAWDQLPLDRCYACWCDTRVEMNLLLACNPSAMRAAWSR